MPADNNLTYSYQKPSPNKLAERALITLERTQKLDLLVHLLSNLQQSLVICGPKGIGKTTLLLALQNSSPDRWHFCQLSGSSSLSFESILQQISRSLNLPGSGIKLDINALRASFAQQKAILIIDDAGDLVPGLVGELAAFADSLTGLRLVFAMSHDEFHIKSNVDKVLEEFHVIELPPLTRKQCWDYLQNLSVHPDMPLSFNGINDTLVDDLYRETHGIPGRILAELPKLNHYNSRQYKKQTLLWLGMIAATATAGFSAYSWLMQSPPTVTVSASNIGIVSPLPSITNSTPPTVTPSVSSLPSPVPAPALTTALVSAAVPTSIPFEAITPTPDTIAALATSTKPTPAPSVITIQQQTQDPLRATITPSAVPATSIATPTPMASTPTPSQLIDPTPVQPSSPATPTPTAISKATIVAAPVSAVDKKPTVENTSAAANDQEWIMAQPANNFTLQVMTLSSKDSVRRFMKKYAEYGEDLKYYSVHKGEQEKFILIYGSFESIAEANRYKEIMPGEFKQALEKRFRIVQKESHR